MVLQQYILSTTYDPQHEVMSIHPMKDESLSFVILTSMSHIYSTQECDLKSWRRLLDLIVAPPLIVEGLY